MKINLWVLLLAFVIIYFVFQIREDMVRFNELGAENRLLRKSLDELARRNQELAVRLGKLKGDYFIEALARERLNLIKKGEIAYKVCPQL